MLLPARQYAVYVHKGSYSQLDNFYRVILQNIPKGYNLDEGMILERYHNSPTDTIEAELLTEVLLPIIKLK
jgi:effector-binding domain-containing protein